MLLARIFSGHWFSVLIVCAPIVVHALKECSKVDVCKCSTDEGVIDLWSLAGTGSDIPRFKDIADRTSASSGITVSWNPCNKWTQETTSTKQNTCQDVAVCYSVHVAGFGRYFDIGQQETADYSFNETSETCVLTLKGKAFPDSGPRSSSTRIFLQCDPHEEGRLESLDRSSQINDEFKEFMKLHTKYACVKSGLSVGSILVIVFMSLLVVYLVAGILFNKYSKGASGKELIPNVNFWTDFPLLVKTDYKTRISHERQDGVVFSFECCKHICSRKQSSYESI